MFDSLSQKQIEHMIVALFLSFICLYNILSYLKRRRSILDTPTSKLRSAAQGYVELNGIADVADDFGGESLRAPLTGQECIWYRYSIERYVEAGNYSRWSIIEDGSSHSAFKLVDGNAFCYVFPDGADVTTHRRQQWTGSEARPFIPSSFSNYSSALRSMLPINYGVRYRYTEEIMCEGDFIFALGNFETCYADRTEAMKKVKVKKILDQWQKNHAMLLATFDQNGDGEIDEDEWISAKESAAALVDYDFNPSDGKTGLNILAKCPYGRSFVLSNSDEKDLKDSFRNRIILYTAGLITCAVFFIYTLKL